MEIHLKIIGTILIGLALVHVIFPRYFDWVNDLKPVSLINRQMMYVHTLFVALVVLLNGLLCITSSAELAETDLGHKICLGLFIFWFVRLVIQFFGYSADLWRGKKFETMVHIMFSILWLYFSVTFFMVFWNGVNTAE